MAKVTKKIETTMKFNHLTTLQNGEHEAKIIDVDTKPATSNPNTILSFIIGEMAGNQVRVLAVRKDPSKVTEIVVGETFKFRKYINGQWANAVTFV
jgi:hypothetical protein